MRIISHKKLIEFWEKHPDTENALENFHKIINKTNFEHFAQLRKTFPSADQVGKCTIFNIGGNKLRVITAIHYNSHIIYIRHVLTHADYDKDKWKIECDSRPH